MEMKFKIGDNVIITKNTHKDLIEEGVYVWLFQWIHWKNNHDNRISWPEWGWHILLVDGSRLWIWKISRMRNWYGVGLIYKEIHIREILHIIWCVGFFMDRDQSRGHLAGRSIPPVPQTVPSVAAGVRCLILSKCT